MDHEGSLPCLRETKPLAALPLHHSLFYFSSLFVYLSARYAEQLTPADSIADGLSNQQAN
jgi:hypothetical protein